jgi:hypothetical protein
MEAREAGGSPEKRRDNIKEVCTMFKVRTFMSPLKIFHTMEELSSLDDEVNAFVAEGGMKRIVSASDSCTTDDTGATIGIIRVIAYET